MTAAVRASESKRWMLGVAVAFVAVAVGVYAGLSALSGDGGGSASPSNGAIVVRDDDGDM